MHSEIEPSTASSTASAAARVVNTHRSHFLCRVGGGWTVCSASYRRMILLSCNLLRSLSVGLSSCADGCGLHRNYRHRSTTTPHCMATRDHPHSSAAEKQAEWSGLLFRCTGWWTYDQRPLRCVSRLHRSPSPIVRTTGVGG